MTTCVLSIHVYVAIGIILSYHLKVLVEITYTIAHDDSKLFAILYIVTNFSNQILRPRALIN